jgi:ABC-type nickel/cobalt efflux system permease component RcnA
MNTGPEPIQLVELLIRLIVPPAVFLLSGAIHVVTTGAAFPLPIAAGLFLIIYGLINARNLAKRLAAKRVLRDDTGQTRPKYFIPLCTTGLYCCQLAIGFGGCVALVIVNV